MWSPVPLEEAGRSSFQVRHRNAFFEGSGLSEVIGRPADANEAPCSKSGHGSDAMPSHTSERSELAKQVERCRRLANELTDPGTVQELLTLANEIELRLVNVRQRLPRSRDTP